ncbi:MAG: hypothetical protein GXY67_00695 [Clostridiales bacterium]|nr:hypothetical protein [Clostridiales bacterium]
MGTPYGQETGALPKSDAQVVGAGPVDLVGMTACDLYELITQYCGGWYWDQSERYLQHSPIRHVQNVNRPR